MAFRAFLAKYSRSLYYIVACGCSVHCFGEYVAKIVVCNGPSMEPTLRTDDIIISEHVTTGILGNFYQGDIVLFRSPSDPNTLLLKRIVATPGTKIRSKGCFDCQETVPIGHLWVEGDNKSNSCDSRDYGPICKGLVKGRALFRIWPLDSIQLLTFRR